VISAVFAALLFAQAKPATPGAQKPASPPSVEDQRELPSAVEAMNRARVTFEYGDYAQASKLLAALVERGTLESATLRAEAYRLLGLSLFYQGRKGESHRAFLEYLYLEPNAELDPFYVPPAAVSFFDQVKKEAEPRLAPSAPSARRRTMPGNAASPRRRSGAASAIWKKSGASCSSLLLRWRSGWCSANSG
jgi:hypothetical protein